MINFFPTPYKDELLYSTLSRYHIRSGNVSYISTLEDLFQSGSKSTIVELPTNIEIIIENMPIGKEYTAEGLIKENTLFFLYTAFLDNIRKKNVFDRMRNGGGKGIQSMAAAVPVISGMDNHFKICSKCYAEDELQYGEGYLHRIHQAPGVAICNKHKELLKISKEKITFISKTGFINISDIEFIDNIYLDNLSESDMEKLTAIGSDIEYLLNNEVSNKPRSWFVEQYKNRLKELGLCTIKGVININEVMKQFVDYYGEDILGLYNVNQYANNKTNWIKYMLRNQDTSVHPIKHLLMINYLGLDIKRIFSEKIEYKPFGDGPWPCLNKVCSHYLKPSIDKVEITYNSHAKKPVGGFECGCGYKYLRQGPDTSKDDLFRSGKVMKLGHVWEEKLSSYLRLGQSLNEIEKRMYTDQNTIKKYAKKLGFDNYLNVRCKTLAGLSSYEKEQKKKEKKMRKIEHYRTKWLELIEKNPSKGITELRMTDITLQDYLYKNDREWLFNHCPEKRKRQFGNLLVDWEEKDKEVLELVKAAADDIKNMSGRPKKITITLIGKKIGLEHFLISNIDKLTRTKKYIESIADTNKSYQVRKVEWAIHELAKEGEGLKWCKVYDKAGLNEKEIADFKEELKAFLLSE